MFVELFDKVLLTSGDTAYIVEIYEQGKAYEADITHEGSTRTDTIRHQEIVKIIG